MTENDPFYGLGYTTPEEAQSLRSNGPSYPEDLPKLSTPETRRGSHRRSGIGPNFGEDEGVGYEGGVPYYLQPRPVIDAGQEAINRAGMEALHPELDIILHRQMLGKAGGSELAAAALLRAHRERNRRSQ